MAIVGCAAAAPELQPAITVSTVVPSSVATATLAPTLMPVPTPLPSTPTPTATPLPPASIVRYVAYRVKPGDTLDSIGAQGGTTPDLLARYNRLNGEPQPGRELIIPQLTTQASLEPKPWLIVRRGNTTRRRVALTLDCGMWNKHTYAILETLKTTNVRITFFLHGDLVATDPELLRLMVEHGHELANHSYSHPDFTTLTNEQIADELKRTEDAVYNIVGPNVSIRPYFRFPYGAFDERTLKAVITNGYLPIHWTLDSLDSIGKPKTPEFIAWRITTGLPPEELPNAIILAHCTGKVATALPEVLQTFAAEGIEVRTLSDVLGP